MSNDNDFWIVVLISTVVAERVPPERKSREFVRPTKLLVTDPAETLLQIALGEPDEKSSSLVCSPALIATVVLLSSELRAAASTDESEMVMV